MKLISLLLTPAAALILGGTANAQILNPIAVTLSGTYAGDAIYGPVTGDNTATVTVDGGTGTGAFHYVEQGYYADDLTYGLPATGTIVSASNTLTKVATFQLQGPNATNIVKFDGTITLTTPAAYSNIAILANALNSAGTPESFTLNFSSGPSTTFTLAADIPYWVGGDPTASGGTIAGTFATLDQSGSENGSGINFDEYDFALSGPDSERTLDSITLNSNGDYLVTYALSGTLTVPEPSTYAMMGLGLLALIGIRRARQLS